MAFNISGALSLNINHQDVFTTNSLKTFYRNGRDLYYFNKDINDFELFLSNIFSSNVDYTINNRGNIYNEIGSDLLYIVHQNYRTSSTSEFNVEVYDLNTKELVNSVSKWVYTDNAVFLQFITENRFIHVIHRDDAPSTNSILLRRFDVTSNFYENATTFDMPENFRFHFYFVDSNNELYLFLYNEVDDLYKIYLLDKISYFPFEVTDLTLYQNLIDKILNNKIVDFTILDNKNSFITIEDYKVYLNNGSNELTNPSSFCVSENMKFNIVDKNLNLYLDNEIANFDFNNVIFRSSFLDEDGYIYLIQNQNILYKSDDTVYDIFSNLEGNGNGDDDDDGEEQEESLYYGNIEKAELYFQKRNKEAYDYFSALTTEEKESLLLNATTIIDNNNFIGYKKEEDQFKQFPRLYDRKVELNPPVYEYYFNGGYDIKYHDTVTKELDITLIEQATYETAYVLSITQSLYSTNEEIEGIQTERLDGVGSFTYFESQALKEKSGYDLMPLVAKMYIKRYLRNNKSRMSIETRLGVQF